MFIGGGARVEPLGGHLGLVAVSATLAVSWSIVVVLSVDWVIEWSCTERRADGVIANRWELGIVGAEFELGGGLVFDASGTNNFGPMAKTFATLCLLWWSVCMWCVR